MYIYSTGFQMFDFSAFLHDSLSASNTRITICGLPLTPFECIRVPLVRASTTSIFIDALFDSLLQQGITVLFLANLCLLKTCLHRLVYLKETLRMSPKVDSTLIVGTTPERISAFQVLCKPVNVPLRTTRRITRLSHTGLVQSTLFLGSLLKQYGACALMACQQVPRKAGVMLESFELTKGADTYMIETHHFGSYVMLVFGHEDLAWDAFESRHVWWLGQVHLLTEPFFKTYEWTPVVVKCTHSRTLDAETDSFSLEENAIQFLEYLAVPKNKDDHTKYE